jgi:hypothetical protein
MACFSTEAGRIYDVLEFRRYRCWERKKTPLPDRPSNEPVAKKRRKD